MNLAQQMNRYQDAKKQLWYEQNCLNEENLKYIKNVLLKPFKINEIQNCFGESSILLEYGLNTYKIEIDKENLCLILLKRNQANNKKDKEYFHLVHNAGENGCFYGDSWYDVVRFISKKG